MKRRIKKLFLVLLAPAWALATDRFFPDATGVSPNGRYRVVATSKDNQKTGERKAFQASFRYTCRDTVSNLVLWMRDQPMEEPAANASKDDAWLFPKEGSPVSIFVNDAGYTVVRTGWDELLLIPPSGRMRANLSALYDGLSRGDYKRYVHKTTAGPAWSGDSHWYFASADGKDYFCIRTWWDSRVIVDLADGCFVNGGRPLLQKLESEEKAFILRTLEAATADIGAVGKGHPMHNCALVGRTLTAAHMAGRMGVREAVPFLRKLESVDYVGSYTSSSCFKYKAGPGKVSIDSWGVYSVRRPVQLALRRLGEKAAVLPATRLPINVPEGRRDGGDEYYIRKTGQPPPEANAASVKAGMTPEQVMDLIDAPDYVESADQSWEYDMDGDTPCTIVVYWGEDGVRKIKKHKPYWKDGNRRDDVD